MLYSLIAWTRVTEFLDRGLEQMFYKGLVNDATSENQGWTGAFGGCIVEIKFPACCDDDVPACSGQSNC